jgi:hypothetical protein
MRNGAVVYRYYYISHHTGNRRRRAYAYRANPYSRGFCSRGKGGGYGYLVYGAMVAPAIGPTIGGYFVDYVDWRWLFFVNVPIGIVSILGSIAILPRDIPIKKYVKKFDIFGFLFMALSMGSLLYALNEGQTYGWHAPIIVQSEVISGFSLVFL